VKTILTTTIVAAALLACAGRAGAASPSPGKSPVPLPSQSAGVDIGNKTSGIGTTGPVAQPSPARTIDALAPGRPDEPQPDTPGKTGLGVTDRVPVGRPMDGSGSKTDGIGSPPNAGAGAH
jgi:hypothetical protein